MSGSDKRSAEAETYRRLYKDKRWRGKSGIRARRLALEPNCRMCAKQGHITIATVVDHIREHKGKQELFFSFTNTQSLCVEHHNKDKQQIERRGHSSAIGEDGWPTDPSHPVNMPGGG